jgi:hypothetical protein
MEKLMLIYFEKFDTWNTEVIFQAILYISLIWSILSSVTSKSYRMLHYIQVAYKHVDPPTSMC